MNPRRLVRKRPCISGLAVLSGSLLGPGLFSCDASRATPASANDSNVGQTPETVTAFYCKETLEPLAIDKPLPASFVRSVAPSLVLGDYQTEVVWQSSLKGHSYRAETDDTALTLSIESLSTVEIVTRTAANRDPTGALPANITSKSLGCEDTLRTTLSGRIATAGGSLNEPVSLVMEALPSGVWLGQVDLPLPELSGSFDANLALPDGVSPVDSPVLRAFLGISDQTLVGDLELFSGDLLDATGTTRDAGVRERIAHFPSGNFCGPEFDVVSREQLERRTAMSAALAQLNAAQPVTMVADEAVSPSGSLELVFRAADDSICQQTATAVQSVLLTHAELSLRSLDGRIEGVVSTDIVVVHDPARIEASAQLLSQDAEINSELPRRFGINDSLDLNAYEAASVQLVIGLTGAHNWGSLQVAGRNTEACGASADAGLPSQCGSQRLWGIHWGQMPDE